eukprot:g6614.t1
MSPALGWYWKSSNGGNINHYKHETNGKEIVSTWGELTKYELSILDSNRNGADMLKQMHMPQKRKATKQTPYVGDEEGHNLSV